jgi:hypothetical protein
MTELVTDQISEGLTFSFGERNNARVSRTLSVVQRDGETYEQARARTVAQVRKEIAVGVDFWMMRCGSPPRFYEGEKWCVLRDYAKPPRVIVAPDSEDGYKNWQRVIGGFPFYYAEGYAARLMPDVGADAKLVVCRTSAEVPDGVDFDIPF